MEHESLNQDKKWKINCRAALDHFGKLWLIVERKVKPLTTQQIWKNDLFRESPVGTVIWCEEGNGILEPGSMLTGFSAYIVFEAFTALTVHWLYFPRFKIILSPLGIMILIKNAGWRTKSLWLSNGFSFFVFLHFLLDFLLLPLHLFCLGGLCWK